MQSMWRGEIQQKFVELKKMQIVSVCVCVCVCGGGGGGGERERELDLIIGIATFSKAD